jgi:hypothetical protein
MNPETIGTYFVERRGTEKTSNLLIFSYAKSYISFDAEIFADA